MLKNHFIRHSLFDIRRCFGDPGDPWRLKCNIVRIVHLDRDAVAARVEVDPFIVDQAFVAVRRQVEEASKWRDGPRRQTSQVKNLLLVGEAQLFCAEQGTEAVTVQRQVSGDDGHEEGIAAFHDEGFRAAVQGHPADLGGLGAGVDRAMLSLGERHSGAAQRFDQA